MCLQCSDARHAGINGINDIFKQALDSEDSHPSQA